MLNSITIMGRLVRDPELKKTGSGVSVANFTVAVDRDIAAQGQEKETDFIDCVAWRATADFVSKYFTKGKMIALKGRLQIRSWTDKDGNKRKTAEVVADNVYFAESKRDSGSNTGSYSENTNGYGASAYPETQQYIQQQGYGQASYGGEYGIIAEADDELPF